MNAPNYVKTILVIIGKTQFSTKVCQTLVTSA